MNILKQQLMQLKTTVDSVVSSATAPITTNNSPNNDKDTRVIVHDTVQVRGNIHRLLSATHFSSSTPAALVSSAEPVKESDGNDAPVTMVTTFVLAIGSTRIPIVASMDLMPTLPKLMEREKELAAAPAQLEVVEQSASPVDNKENNKNQLVRAMMNRMRSMTNTATDQGSDGEDTTNLFTDDKTFSIVSKDGKYLSIRLSNRETYLRWHHAIRESIAELIFTRAFQLHPIDKTLSIRRLELALQRGHLLVLPANCHFLRAKRLWNVKMDLNEIVNRILENPTTISREEVIQFLQHRASCDRVSDNHA